MKCYRCNATLSEHDFCNECGADVKFYKKIICSSEVYYNQGLFMAQMRDLSGAADCLRRSVKLNKHNTKARNLLGLVYFEMGEAVAALSEWVISKSLQPEKNIADVYLNDIQKNAGKLETISQTIKKYNQALLYAKQKNKDLAIIQLKKVLNMNPNLIKGHQLLALLYIDAGDQEKAFKQLKRAQEIDKNNPLTLRYLREIESDYEEKKRQNNKAKVKEKREEERRAMRGDDVIIPPTSYRESNAGGITVLNVVIGILLGVALMWFLVLPAKEKSLAETNNDAQEEYSKQLESKNVIITGLESEKEVLQASIDNLQAEIETYKGKDGIISSYQNLLSAVETYLAGDPVSSAESLAQIDMSIAELAPYQGLYDSMYEDTVTKAVTTLYEQGYEQYRSEKNMQQARETLQKAYDINPEGADADLLYYLGRSCIKVGDITEGNQYLKMVIEKYPDSSYVKYAKQYMVTE